MPAVSSHFPPSHYVPVFPAGPSVWHGSAVECDDKRVLYVYVEGSEDGGAIRGLYFPDSSSFTHEAVDGDVFIHHWRQGKPIPGSDHLIIDCQLGAATAWKHPDGRMFLSASYWPGGLAGLEQRIEIWESPSRNGGDWVLHSVVQHVTGGGGIIGYGSAGNTAGQVTVTSAGWVLPASFWLANGTHWPAVWLGTGDGTSWSMTYHDEYGFVGGIYGEGESRQIAEADNGHLFWTSFGALDPDRIAISTDGGASWASGIDYPDGTFNQLLGVANGDLYRSRFVPGGLLDIESASSTAGPWTVVTDDLNLGDRFDGHLIGRPPANGMLWQALSPGKWVLSSHDKCWFNFGGWVVGANGYSW